MDSIEALEKEISTCFLDEKYVTRFKEYVSNKNGIIDRLVSSGMVKHTSPVIKRFISTELDSKNVLGKVSREILNQIVDFSSCIFIFDDLERCGCKINDLFGFLNNLVEHEETKMILVANESEIGRYDDYQNKELQYLVAAQPNIVLKTKGISLSGLSGDESIDGEELARRKSELFDSAKHNEEYQRIKEKLVGVTIKFVPNTREIISSLINEMEIKELKEMLSVRVDDFIYDMDNCNHRNLRSFQFFISKVCYLYEKTNQAIEAFENELGETIERKSQIINQVISNTFYESMLFKGAKYHEYDFNLKAKPIVLFSSVHNYVVEADYDEIIFYDDIKTYYLTDIKEKLANDDPLLVMKNEWYLHTQKEVEALMKEIIQRLKDNKYSPVFFSEILKLFISREMEGFDAGYLEKAYSTIIEQVKEQDIKDAIHFDSFMVNTPEINRKCKEKVDSINEIIKGQSGLSVELKIKGFMHNEDWAELLDAYVMTKEYSSTKQHFLCLVDSEEWIKKLKESSPYQTYKFREAVYTIYSKESDISNDITEEDINVFKDIDKYLKDSIKEENMDLILKLIYGWMISDIDKYLQR